METRPAKEIVKIVGNVGVDTQFRIERTLSLADHPLIVGERYQPKDIPIRIYQNLGLYVSGVNLVGVGQQGCFTLNKIRNGNPIKEYEILCRLGMATDTFAEKGKLIAASKFKYVTPQRINILCNKIVSANSRYALRSLGAEMHSQAAYDIISNGSIRPSFNKSDPVLYSLKCIEFKEPYFKLKVSAVNENYLYFYHLINRLGLLMKTHACVSSISCRRLGKFTVDDALSYKELTAENIINNIAKSKDKITEILEQNRSFNNRNTKINKNLNVDERFKNYKSPINYSP